MLKEYLEAFKSNIKRLNKLNNSGPKRNHKPYSSHVNYIVPGSSYDG